MKRKSEIIKYSKKDKGILSFQRKDVIAEIPTTVDKSGYAYVGREFVDDHVRIHVIRDKNPFEAYLTERVAWWDKCEKENLDIDFQEAAYRAKIMKECYEDSLKKFKEFEG